MTWNINSKQGSESKKCKWDIVPFTRGKGLELGCGTGKLFQHFIGIDSGKDARLFQAPVVADILCDASDLSSFADGSMDFAFSSHVLEHIQEYEAALKEWWRVIKPDGYLVLYLPHADFYPHVGEPGANPDHVHDFLPDDIIEAMQANGGWDLVVNEERNDRNEYSFLQVYRKSKSEQQTYSCKNKKASKRCAVVRWGAWGDLIQTASIFPGLRNDGYEITLYTTPRGYEVVQHDPLISHVVLQDTDQVPNLELGEYIDFLRTKYEKVVDLSESVETTFLASPGRVSYSWPKEARHAVMNLNYGEMTHTIAGIGYEKPNYLFVPSQFEKHWAKEQVSKFKNERLIMWVLTGSAIHKLYPHIDQVIEDVLKEHDDVRIITVGSKTDGEILESPWKDNPRITLQSGIWSIRETLAIAQLCDVVIGPETGVLNAVAMEPMRKIVFLSHSSIENLTRDWTNTISLHSTKTSCYPCHKMVYKWDQCARDNVTGTAKCMADIDPSTVTLALKMTLLKKDIAA